MLQGKKRRENDERTGREREELWRVEQSQCLRRLMPVSYINQALVIVKKTLYANTNSTPLSSCTLGIIQYINMQLEQSVTANDSFLKLHNKSLPKSSGKSRVATPHGREWTRLLHMLLSAQCPLQTSPITQPRVRYIFILTKHRTDRSTHSE